ncbi:hypothetical protein [Nostoc sp. DSM 114167]|jgi:hypothetical protein|uniref:hypothetical protein n=1 Tax=Nostoc sp. DSM 114167 TaxID=3439050 RepID=UPI004045A1A6
MKRNPTLLPDLCWVTLSLHPTYKTTTIGGKGGGEVVASEEFGAVDGLDVAVKLAVAVDDAC